MCADLETAIDPGWPGQDRRDAPETAHDAFMLGIRRKPCAVLQLARSLVGKRVAALQACRPLISSDPGLRRSTGLAWAVEFGPLWGRAGGDVEDP